MARSTTPRPISTSAARACFCLHRGSYRIRITDHGDPSALRFDYAATPGIHSGTVLTLAVVARAAGSLPDLAALPEKAGALVLANQLS